MIYFTIAFVMIVEAHVLVSKSEYVGEFKNENTSVIGTITDVKYKSSEYSCFETAITSINGIETDIKAILEIPSHSTLKKADTYSATGVLTPLSFTDENYLIADGFNGRFVCDNKDDLRIKSIQMGNTESIFSRINSTFQAVLNEKTNGEIGPFVGALLLGNRDGLSDETLRDFHRTGISHMLALSGLHMSIIIGFFDLILKNLFVDKKKRCVILIFLSIAYLAITGFSPSASRAVIMLCIVYLSYLINSESESITSLFIALTLIIIISPYAVYDVGLWMSFFATMAIIVVSEILSGLKYHIKKKPIPIRILITMTTSILLTLAAIFSLCAFSWLCFGEISIVSPLTNLIFSPIMTVILGIGLLTIIFSPVPILSVALGKVLIAVSSLFMELASSISHWENITISLRYDFTAFIILPLVITLIVFLVIKLPRKWMIAIPPILAVIAFSISLSVYQFINLDKSSVLYMKDKRSEMLVVAAVSDAIVCDISTGGYSNLFDACDSAMDHESTTEIEGIVLTHYHNYHAKSLGRVCDKYLVRNVYLPLPENDTEQQLYDEIRETLKNARTNAITYKKGVDINVMNNIYISVSKHAYIKRSNHPIFTVSVSNDTKSLVYSTSAIFEASVLSHAKNSDIFILGTHGPTVKSLTDETIFASMNKVPQTLVFSSPQEMLNDKNFLFCVHELYQKGHTVILDGRESCRFELN